MRFFVDSAYMGLTSQLWEVASWGVSTDAVGSHPKDEVCFEGLPVLSLHEIIFLGFLVGHFFQEQALYG